METRPSLNLLHSFVVFSEARNIVEAATKLEITQPALSAQLQRLEAALPLRAFTMVGKKKVLTAYGTQLHLSLKGRIESLYDSVRVAHQSFLGEENITLKIGGRSEIVLRLLPSISFKGCVEVTVSTGRAAVGALQRGELDCVLTERRADAFGIVGKKIVEEGAQLHVPRRFLKRIGPVPSLAAIPLETIPCLIYSRKEPMLSEFLTKRRISFQKLRIRRICEDWPVIVRLVERGLGWALAPDAFSPKSDGVISFEIPAHLVSHESVFVYYRKELSAFPWFGKFLAEVQATLKH